MAAGAARSLYIAVLFLLPTLTVPAFGLGEPRLISFKAEPGAFVLANQHQAPAVMIDDDEWPGVLRAAADFRADIETVSGAKPGRQFSISSRAPAAIIVGTLGRSTLIDELAQAGKIDTSAIRGQWEAGMIAVVDHPLPDVDQALVIAGSDKRGTIFALYTVSEQIGVSPWAWWADVRVPHHDEIYVLPGVHLMPSPAVRYRGIFLNDEAPALSGWTREKFGGFNHNFYEHVFELLLRLRANYLWPAMWGSAFNEDDPLNPRLADEYGIVMGTSHHEPMLRAQREWKPHGQGLWDYQTNSAELDTFWAEGIQRNKGYESTITIGMRGDGDKAMSPSVNTALLAHIIDDQRKIIAANENPAKHDPQVWALYKEVQEYYEKGMRVPDDVTLLWSDDNWGNLRRLPTPEERRRSGGAGIYYHFDYVGGPRSYKWLNDISITKVWEQMSLAVEYGADRVWIVNVGDLKPMEFPIEFFLTMARDPKRWGKNDLDAYTVTWATREFGAEHAQEIAQIIARYTQYNSRRKPEQLTPETYSFGADREADRIESEWKALSVEADEVAGELAVQERASYFELVQYPVDACANLGRMYIAAGRNHLYAKQGRVSANFWADETERLFAHDAELSNAYNSLLNGRWHHMMDQTHIGYTSWGDPKTNTMPAVQRIPVPAVRRLGVFSEDGGSPGASTTGDASLSFDPVNRQVHAIELAPLGSAPAPVKLSTSAPWVRLSLERATVATDVTVKIDIDWSHAPQAPARATVSIRPDGQRPASVEVRLVPVPGKARGFIENAGVVAIDAEHSSRADTANGVRWETLPGFGLTLSGIESFPVTASSTLPGSPQACVEYDFTTLTAGSRTLQAILAPTLAFVPNRGLRYSVQLDRRSAQTIDAWETKTDGEWARAVSDGVHRVSTPLGALAAGPHTLRFCRVDAGVVLERILIFTSPPPAYLGPLESAQVHDAKPHADVRPAENQWTGSWASAQQAVCDQSELPKHPFEGTTLRETVHLSLGGSQIRLRLSNLFGNQPLLIFSMAVAHARPGMPGAIDIKSSVPARFNGATTVTVPPGAEVVSDNIPLSVQPLSDLAVSLTIGSAPICATSHPGARATAFVLAGDHVTDEFLTGSESFVHWHFLSAVEVSGGVSNGAVAVLGDSITDGHGATTDGNDRWTDVLAARLAPRKIAVLNFGIGGNRVLADGIGPSAFSRFGRDALGGAGVHTVILLEGINDLGLDRVKEHSQEDHDALVDRLQTAMKGMIESAHRKGICVLGGTLTPYVGSTYYHPGPRSEADREKLNTWIRASGVFDGIIDFDKMLRDPAEPDRLDPDADSGDHLHPGPKGYRRMAEGVPLDLPAIAACFRLPTSS